MENLSILVSSTPHDRGDVKQPLNGDYSVGSSQALYPKAWIPIDLELAESTDDADRAKVDAARRSNIAYLAHYGDQAVENRKCLPPSDDAELREYHQILNSRYYSNIGLLFRIAVLAFTVGAIYYFPRNSDASIVTSTALAALTWLSHEISKTFTDWQETARKATKTLKEEWRGTVVKERQEMARLWIWDYVVATKGRTARNHHRNRGIVQKEAARLSELAKAFCNKHYGADGKLVDVDTTKRSSSVALLRADLTTRQVYDLLASDPVTDDTSTCGSIYNGLGGVKNSCSSGLKWVAGKISSCCYYIFCCRCGKQDAASVSKLKDKDGSGLSRTQAWQLDDLNLPLLHAAELIVALSHPDKGVKLEDRSIGFNTMRSVYRDYYMEIVGDGSSPVPETPRPPSLDDRERRRSFDPNHGPLLGTARGSPEKTDRSDVLSPGRASPQRRQSPTMASRRLTADRKDRSHSDDATSDADLAGIGVTMPSGAAMPKVGGTRRGGFGDRNWRTQVPAADAAQNVGAAAPVPQSSSAPTPAVVLAGSAVPSQDQRAQGHLSAARKARAASVRGDDQV